MDRHEGFLPFQRPSIRLQHLARRLAFDQAIELRESDHKLAGCEIVNDQHKKCLKTWYNEAFMTGTFGGRCAVPARSRAEKR